MRSKKLLAGILLGVSLCFIPVLGYGKLHPMLKEYVEGGKGLWIEYNFLEAAVRYIMCNPTSFLWVEFDYDPIGIRGVGELPEGVSSKGKIFVLITDNRGVFSRKSETTLLNQFKRELKTAYSYISFFAWDMNTDIVAKFYNRERIPLGYFYQGEYHLWEKVGSDW